MKTLILDAGGVLVYPRLGEWHIPFRAAEILGPERARDLCTPRFRRAQAACMPWLDESRLVIDVETERMLRRGFVLELDRAMGWGMTDAQIRAMADDFTDNVQRYGFFDDVREWIDRWSGEYTLAVLSDAMPSLFHALEDYGIVDAFSAIVISSHVGAMKPGAEMYRAALDRLGAASADCLFVDDRAVNLTGAIAAGMNAVQMSRPECPADSLWDGPVAHSFSELDAILKEDAPV